MFKALVFVSNINMSDLGELGIIDYNEEML